MPDAFGLSYEDAYVVAGDGVRLTMERLRPGPTLGPAWTHAQRAEHAQLAWNAWRARCAPPVGPVLPPAPAQGLGALLSLTSAQVRLHAWMMWAPHLDEAARRARPTVIFFQENAGNMAFRWGAPRLGGARRRGCAPALSGPAPPFEWAPPGGARPLLRPQARQTVQRSWPDPSAPLGTPCLAGSTS